jgi:hypothetical protein
MKSRFALPVLLSTSLLFLVVSFQNCGSFQQATDGSKKPVAAPIKTSFDPAFFGYPYQEAPKVFSSILFVSEKVGSTRFSKVETFVAIADPKGEETELDYNLQMVNDKGQMVCPSLQGRLADGDSNISLSCETGNLSGKTRIIVETKIRGETLVVERSF